MMIYKKKIHENSSKRMAGYRGQVLDNIINSPRNKEFKTTFDYKDKFRANFIATEPLTLNENSSIEEELQIIVAAKRVDVIDGYAKTLNIDKFDLVIDWGFFCTLLLNHFFLVSTISSNFLEIMVCAIIAITICIRLAFFPLANFSFRSMAKMKALQPEMVRLKELQK